MPELNVRLGYRIRSTDNGVARSVATFLDELRFLVADVGGITNSADNVETIVTRDELNLDRNVEVLKIVLSIEDSEDHRKFSQSWLATLANLIDASLIMCGVPNDLIPDFQLEIVVGAHHSGLVFNRESNRVTHNWVDEALRDSSDR